MALSSTPMALIVNRSLAQAATTSLSLSPSINWRAETMISRASVSFNGPSWGRDHFSFAVALVTLLSAPGCAPALSAIAASDI